MLEMKRPSKMKWTILTVIIIITLHFKIFTFLGFEVALATILIPIWVFYSFKINFFIYKNSEFKLLLFIALIPFLTKNIEHWPDFFKTYFQFIISYYLVIRSFYSHPVISFNNFIKTIKIIQISLLITIILQFLLVIGFNQTQFYNIFGDNQLMYQLDIAKANYRMKGYYLEPSFLGLVVINLFFIRQVLNLEKFDLPNFIISLTVLMLTKSAFAYFAFLFLTIYFFHQAFIRPGKNYKITFVYTILFILVFILSDSLINALRLNELNLTNTNQVTSGYMRLIYPITLIYNIVFIEKSILGLGFGQLEHYVQTFKFMNYSEITINNAFFAIIGYWGITAIIFYAFLLYKYFKRKNVSIKIFIILVFINLNNSGAFVTLQFVFVAVILPYMAISLNEQKPSNHAFYNYHSNSK